MDVGQFISLFIVLMIVAFLIGLWLNGRKPATVSEVELRHYDIMSRVDDQIVSAYIDMFGDELYEEDGYGADDRPLWYDYRGRLN